MSSSKKEQSTADKTLRDSPTYDSAPSDLAARARTKLEQYKRFSVGDMVVCGLLMGLITPMRASASFTANGWIYSRKKYDSFCRQVL